MLEYPEETYKELHKRKTQNPLYSNHLFKDFDINRVKISKWEYPFLWFLPTYVQMTDNYVIKYKQWGGRYFFMGFEEFKGRE